MDYELFSAQRRHDFRHRLDLLAAVRVAPAEQQRVIDPVSYTHLDVYKRQAMSVRMKFLLRNLQSVLHPV